MTQELILIMLLGHLNLLNWNEEKKKIYWRFFSIIIDFKYFCGLVNNNNFFILFYFANWSTFN